MNLVCATHPTVSAEARCVTCGHHLCNDCRRKVGVRNYCQLCSQRFHGVTSVAVAVPELSIPKLDAKRPRSSKSPIFASVLSLIPGLGQMYAGHALRGLLFLGAAIGAQQWHHQLPGLVLCFLYVFNLFDSYRIAQIRNERVVNGGVASGSRSDDWLFTFVGLFVLFFTALQTGSLEHALPGPLGQLSAVGAGLLLAQATRR